MVYLRVCGCLLLGACDARAMRNKKEENTSPLIEEAETLLKGAISRCTLGICCGSSERPKGQSAGLADVFRPKLAQPRPFGISFGRSLHAVHLIRDTVTSELVVSQKISPKFD